MTVATNSVKSLMDGFVLEATTLILIHAKKPVEMAMITIISNAMMETYLMETAAIHYAI